jgi:hypothetical protein
MGESEFDPDCTMHPVEALSMAKPRSSSALLVLLASAAPLAAQGRVWVVDDQAGPGVHFTSLSTALFAASSKDLVLVKDGKYGGGTVGGKSLTICAEAGATVMLEGELSFSSTVPNSFAMRGVGHAGQTWSNVLVLWGTPESTAWIEDCSFQGKEIVQFFPQSAWGRPAVTVGALSATLARSSLSMLPTVYGLATLDALDAQYAARVSAYDTEFVAGIYGAGAVIASAVPAFPALYASGCSFTGGDSALAGWPSCMHFNGGQYCTPGESGAGVALMAGASAVTLGCTIAPGNTAPPLSCPSGPCADIPSPPVSSFGASHTVLAEAPRSFEASSPIRAGQSTVLSSSGIPGDLVVVLYALRQQHTFLPGSGTLLVPPTIGIETGTLVLGALGASGQLQVAVPIPAIPPGREFLEIFLQAAHVSPQLVVVLSGGSLLDVLDPAF